MKFDELNLIEPLLRAVEAEGYTNPTLIQEMGIPNALAGKDLLGCAQTGTGKTAAFALPILQLLYNGTPVARKGLRPVRALVLTPTRELAAQISESFTAYGRHTGLRNTVIYGGVGQRPQTTALKNGTDILVATPGRLLDLMGQGHISFASLEILVLDEADRMLDMGFIIDVKRIIRALPRKRQTLFFSATLPKDILELAQDILVNPLRLDVTPNIPTPERINQAVFPVDRQNKAALLVEVLKDSNITRALVFTRTKHGADKVVRQLSRAGVRAVAIHGNKAQSARERALEGFKDGRTRVLIATDIAARGLDVDDISHVINFDIPEVAETYVHRIGRTARAGAAGRAISFCDSEERCYLADIERLLGLRLTLVSDHAYPPSQEYSAAPVQPSKARSAMSRPSGAGGGGGRSSSPKKRSGALPQALLAAIKEKEAAPQTVHARNPTRSPGRGRMRTWSR